MRFRHKEGSTPQKKSSRIVSRLILFISIILFAGGIYLLVLVLTPNIPVLYPVKEVNVKALSTPKDDRIYIPKIGVNVGLFEGGPETLDQGSWHRFPERGDPVMGGNFIVSAHRFSLGITPGETRQKSPFYHIDKLEVGDQIIVDYKGKRYGYQITSHSEVKPTQTEIESPISNNEEPRMTLYTCTLKGESDGREVFYAEPLGLVDQNGMIEIEASTASK